MLSLFLLTIGVTSINAQTGPSARPFLIEPNRPLAYLHLDHIGLGAPEEDGKRHERVWVELHNNCRQSITVNTSGAPTGDTADATGVMDELIRTPSFGKLAEADDKKLGPKEMPHDTSFDVGSLTTIKPGKILLFSLPANHFSKRWEIRIRFSFDLPPGKGPRDENDWGGQVQMFLSYSFYDLPPSAQRELSLRNSK